MEREIELPGVEITDDGVGFELVAPAVTLVQLADAIQDATRVEAIGASGTVVVSLTGGPVAISHLGRSVQVLGGRSALDQFADALRFVAAGPAEPSTVAYHLHLEPYDDHPWLAAHSEPAVIRLVD